jgi:uncharacterized membrane protein
MPGVIAMIRPLIVFLAFAWLAWILAAPLLPAAPAGMTYALGSLICHQLSDRSFHLGAVQLPVCARCLGIYAGCAVGTCGFMRLGRDPRRIILFAALPTILTVVAESVGLWRTSNVTRFIAGAPLGFAVALVLIAALPARTDRALCAR